MSIRTWLEPPPAEGVEEALRATILHWLLIAAVVVVTPLTFLLVAIEPDTRFTLPLYLTALAGSAVIFVILHSGWIRTAGVLVCLLAWAVTVWAAFASSGVRSPQLSMAVLVIMLTGFVWSGRAAIGMAIVTSASLLGLEFARDLGWAPEPFLEGNRFTVWAALSSVLALSAVSLQIFVRIVNSARKEAAEKSVRLEEEMRRRVQAEASLHQAQKLEALGRLTGGIAHDFNNILTVLLAESDLLARHAEAGRPLSESELEQISEIRSSTERASALTRQLLAFSSQQVGMPELVDPDASIARFEPMLRRIVREDIELRIEAAAPDAGVRIDAAQFEQVLMNLVLNAVDAMPSGGVLTVRTERASRVDGESAPLPPGAESWVVLVVRDTGVGIDAEDVDRIFDPFFTTKARGRGTGLGLSSVHGIVTAAGGHVTVESPPGRGTTFRVHLPEARRPHRDEKPVREAPEVPGLGRGAILLCEDEAPVRRVTQRALAAAGYRVYEADCAESALRALRDEQLEIDLLITDLIMPGLNGRELAAQVVAERPGVRVLLVSGYTSNVLATREEGPEMELLEKPFTPETLLRRVEKLLAEA